MICIVFGQDMYSVQPILSSTNVNRYSVFRRIPGYYNDKDDAFDMRKPLKRDEDRKHVREDGENRIVSPSDVW